MTPPDYLRDWSYAAAGRVPMSPADALAEAWDEGYQAGLDGVPTANPYRIAYEKDYDDG